MNNITIKKIAITIVIIAISIMFFLIWLSWLSHKEHEKIYAEAYKDFQEVYQYVLENKEIYKDFSEYQILQFNKSDTYLDIELIGDMQEMRDIVLKPFGYYARMGINANGEITVHYHRETTGEYEIICYYYKDSIIRSPYGNESRKWIDGCIEIVLCTDPAKIVA